jgi:acetolactate synthase-1/2/3 large subunit
VVDHLAARLAAVGVRHVFGVGGANIEDFLGAVHRTGGALRTVVAKHESAAATMADGCARTTGRLGVVAATSGGGAMNLLPGLAEAHASRVPVLALVGQPPTGQQGRGAFQDTSGRGGSFDARAVFAPVARCCLRVDDPADAAEALEQAIRAALSEPCGPAVLLLPKDVQQARIPLPRRRPALAEPPPRAAPAAALERAADLLRRARTVLVIAGEGVAAAGAKDELTALARRLGAWVAVTPDAKDVFDNRDAQYAGVAGPMGHRNVAECLRRAEVCLLAGTRLPSTASGGLEHALAGTPLICVDPEPPFTPGLAVTGSVRASLRALLGLLPPAGRPPTAHGGPVPLALPGPRPGAPSYRSALAAVETALPEDAHVFVDAGNAGAAAIHWLPAPRRGRFVVALGMGGMGYTFGAGIGAALATGRRSYVLAGDGSYYMHGAEVHTALQYGAPVTFVVFNNNAHAMCATRDTLFAGGARPDDLFLPADLAAGAAAAFPGLRATRAADPGQLHQALRRGDRNPGPALVVVDADPYETPPFLPFLPGAAAATEETARDHPPVPAR